MVECQLPKLKAAGSNPVSRSKENKDLGDLLKSFFLVLEVFVSIFVSVSTKNLVKQIDKRRIGGLLASWITNHISN